MFACLLTAREWINKFATNLTCLFLETEWENAEQLFMQERAPLPSTLPVCSQKTSPDSGQVVGQLNGVCEAQMLYQPTFFMGWIKIKV
jgi:hypothetical protein